MSSRRRAGRPAPRISGRALPAATPSSPGAHSGRRRKRPSPRVRGWPGTPSCCSWSQRGHTGARPVASSP